jgi:lysophospholipase L1-like esterase
MRFITLAGLAAGCLLLVAAQSQASSRTDWKFTFGPGQAAPGYIAVHADTFYTPDRGYGFERFTEIPAPGTGLPPPHTPPTLQGIDRHAGDPLHSHFIASDKIFLFSAAVPEGNYRVSVTLGDAKEPATTTVKSESRCLMLEQIHTRPGQFVTRSFLVNVRSPDISTGGRVTLDPREIGVFHWDNKLTLEFLGGRTALCDLEIHKVNDAVTVFLCGDSTVTTQVREPWGMWGQMLPRWFDDHVAIADYAESGETLKAFKREHRWAKVMSEVKPGDYVFIQFGDNDLNKRGHNAIWPPGDPEGDWANTYSPANTDYKRLLEEYAKEAQDKGAIPVIISPMTKINMRTGALNIAGLGEYPQAAIAAAKEAHVPYIDLNAMSIEVDKALGPRLDRLAYVDGLHTTSYGGYLLSRCIVVGIERDHLGLAKYLLADAGDFDPTHPAPLPDEFKVPLEPGGAMFGRFRRGR